MNHAGEDGVTAHFPTLAKLFGGHDARWILGSGCDGSVLFVLPILSQ